MDTKRPIHLRQLTFAQCKRLNPEAYAESVRRAGHATAARWQREPDPLARLLECDADEFVRWLEARGL